MISRPTAAFSLVEVTVALGVAGFCLLAIYGLLPVGQVSHQLASEQTVANQIVSEIVSDLRATQKASITPSASSPLFGLTIPDAGGADSMHTVYFTDGREPIGPPDTAASAGTASPRYRATVFLRPPTSGRAATTGRILITWPALADPQPAITPSKFSGSLESFIALDRN